MLSTYWPLTTLDPALLWTTLNNMAVGLLIILLVVYELAVNSGERWQQFARYLHVAIVPLLLSLGVLLVTRVVELLP